MLQVRTRFIMEYNFISVYLMTLFMLAWTLDDIPGCLHEGITYPAGVVQLPNCVTCDCVPGTKLRHCNMTRCPQNENCLQYKTLEGECCPRCVKTGCRHQGTLYARGTHLPTSSPCELCYCSWDEREDGKPDCMHIQCPPVPCVDSHIPSGKCCPVCKNGANCWLGDLIIPAGREVWLAPCRYCSCPKDTSHGERKAVCAWKAHECFG